MITNAGRRWIAIPRDVPGACVETLCDTIIESGGQSLERDDRDGLRGITWLYGPSERLGQGELRQLAADAAARLAREEEEDV